MITAKFPSLVLLVHTCTPIVSVHPYFSSAWCGWWWIAVKAAFLGGRNAGVRQPTALLFESCVTVGKCRAFSDLGFPIHEMEVMLPACRILLRSSPEPRLYCLGASQRPIDSLRDLRSLLQLCEK